MRADQTGRVLTYSTLPATCDYRNGEIFSKPVGPLAGLYLATGINQWTRIGGFASTASIYNIKDYGTATGDGSDATLAIQAAINACVAAGGGRVYMPAGIYGVSAVLTKMSAVPVCLVGENEATVLVLTGLGRIEHGSYTIFRGFCIQSAAVVAGFGSIYSNTANNIEIDLVTFQGGGPHIGWTLPTDFHISRTRHISLTAAETYDLVIVQGMRGSLRDITIEPYVRPASVTGWREIMIASSRHVNVDGVIVRGVDGSTIYTNAAVCFAASSHCNASHILATECKNTDGILCEDWSSDIQISDCDIYDMNNAAGAGLYENSKDGVDLFRASRISMSNINCRTISKFNGGGGWYHGFEIFLTQDVHAVNCRAYDCGGYGWLLASSPGVRLHNCHGSFNGYAGAAFLALTTTSDVNGTAVTRSVGWGIGGIGMTPGTPVIIAGAAQPVDTFTDDNHQVLRNNLGALGVVSVTMQCWGCQVIGGEYSNNGANGAATTGLVEGVFADNFSEVQVIGIKATDVRNPKLQVDGVRFNNYVRGCIIGCRLEGNLTAPQRDFAGLSIVLDLDLTLPGNGHGMIVLNAAGTFQKRIGLDVTGAAVDITPP